MTLDSTPRAETEGSREPGSNLLALRCQAGTNVSQVNPIELVNRRETEAAKEQIRYKSGKTLPSRARKLFADALLADLGRTTRYPRILSRNMIADGQRRPAGVAAHHIVAAKDDRARTSRVKLFGWGAQSTTSITESFYPAGKSPGCPNCPMR